MRVLSSVLASDAGRRRSAHAMGMRRLVIVATAAAISLAASSAASAASPPFTQCPGVGFDSSCAVLFTVNPDGSITTSTDPSQPPFDGVEDTLVGVQNNTAVTTIPSLT